MSTVEVIKRIMYTLQFKRATAARIAQVNPIGLQAEPIYETDTKRWKLMDGTSHYAVLPYQANMADVTAAIEDALSDFDPGGGGAVSRPKVYFSIAEDEPLYDENWNYIYELPTAPNTDYIIDLLGGQSLTLPPVENLTCTYEFRNFGPYGYNTSMSTSPGDAVDVENGPDNVGQRFGPGQSAKFTPRSDTLWHLEFGGAPNIFPVYTQSSAQADGWDGQFPITSWQMDQYRPPDMQLTYLLLNGLANFLTNYVSQQINTNIGYIPRIGYVTGLIDEDVTDLAAPTMAVMGTFDEDRNVSLIDPNADGQGGKMLGVANHGNHKVIVTGHFNGFDNNTMVLYPGDAVTFQNTWAGDWQSLSSESFDPTSVVQSVNGQHGEISLSALGYYNSTQVDGLFTSFGSQVAASIAALINDAVTATNTTLSSTEIEARIQERLDALVGGAPGNLDTLGELADGFEELDTMIDSVLTSLGNRLRIDGSQTLTSGQKQFGRDNLGLGDSAVKNTGTGAGDVAAGNDGRFTNTRTPTDGTVTDAKIVSGGLSQSSINGLVAALATFALANAVVDLTSNQTISGSKGYTGTSTFSGDVVLNRGPLFISGNNLTASATDVINGNPSRNVDASGGAITRTLPATTSAGRWFIYTKVDSSANPVTIAGTIDGQTNYVLTKQYDSVILQSTTTSGSWVTVSTKPKTRVNSQASSATPAVNVDVTDSLVLTALAAAITGITVTGTPADTQPLFIKIKDNGTARALALGSSFQDGVATIPTTTVVGKTHVLSFRYDSAVSKFVCLAAGSY